jgi:Acetyltransferase (GNAT) domain
VGLSSSTHDLAVGFELARAAAGVRQLEIRDKVDSPGMHHHSAGVIHRLPLGSAADVFGRFHASQVQRNIRRGERAGIEVRRADSRAGLDRVFYALHVGTRRRQGVPVQPRRFFTLLWDGVMETGHGFTSLAYAGREPVAGAVFLAWNGTLIYKYGASDPAHWGLRPNHLLFWDAIRWACDHGYHTFDLGRTDRSNSGLRRFKSGWGAAEEPLVYSLLGAPTGAGMGQRLQSLAAPVIRRGPRWLPRLLGEVLYRYSA